MFAPASAEVEKRFTPEGYVAIGAEKWATPLVADQRFGWASVAARLAA